MTIAPETIAAFVEEQELMTRESKTETKTAQAIDLESRGAETWLRTLAPRSFFSPFAAAHREFWTLYWHLLHKKKRGEIITTKERNIFLLLSRGLGKSTNLEMACIAEGAVCGKGFALYLSDTQLLAEEHLFSVKDVLENGQFEQFYPLLSKPMIQKQGTQAKYTQDTIITEGDWAMTARGISGSVRGGRFGSMRFTLVAADDIDKLNDSLMVTDKKLRILSRTVLPAMAKDGLFLMGQNLIQKNSVATQVYERKTDILADRTVIAEKPVKAFAELELEQIFQTDGSPRWTIKRAVPTWEYFDIEDARAFLARSGREAFLAEYQHEFDDKKGKVISNFSEDAQMITWSMFEKFFGTRFIPAHWTAEVAGDIGYSDGMHPHYSAWAFVATAALNSPLPGKLFVYRGMDFTATSIDDQAIALWRAMLPDRDKPYSEYYAEFNQYPHLSVLNISPGEKNQTGGLIKRFQISHEKSGEMMTLRQKYGLPFRKIERYKALDGVSQWNTLSLADHSVSNPFKEDEQLSDDSYLIGCPSLFYIVDDDQYAQPRNHRGLKLMREQIAAWEYVQTRITENGLTEEKPSKINDDYADALKSIFARWGQNAAPLTREERLNRELSASVRTEHIQSVAAVDPELAERLVLQRTVEIGRQNKRENEARRVSSKYKPIPRRPGAGGTNKFGR